MSEKVITEVPINNVGIEKGKTIIALKIADFPKDKAAPRAPNKLIKEVPRRRLIIIGTKLSKGRYKIIAAREEAMRIGGSFRGPGIKARIFSEMRAMIQRAR